MPYKPGLPAIPARHPAGGWQAGLGQGHNQKKDTHTLDFYVTLRTTVKATDARLFDIRAIQRL